MSYQINSDTVIDTNLDGRFRNVFYQTLRIRNSQGENFGYTSGGQISAPTFSNVIDRFPFAATTTNAADVGDILATNYFQTGQQ